MDLVEATQRLEDENTSVTEDEVQVGSLKIGSQSHAIYKGFNRIGRSPLCRVILNDATASKVHAEIQAGIDTAFVSDLRSSNGTKIKDVSIKPFFYYTINDGDVIYFGQVKAEYTTVKTTEPDDFLVPETPIGSTNRNGSVKNTPGIGNISESFLDNSSIYDSDISMIPGTQETEREQQTFQKSSIPIGRPPSSTSLITTVKASDIRKLDDVVKIKELHEFETQNEIDVLLQPPAPKRPRLHKTHQNVPNTEANIHKAETQAGSMLISIPKRKEPERAQNPDDIFDAETQAMSFAISTKKDTKELSKHDNIFDAETQPMAVEICTKKASRQPDDRDDIFVAETQASSVTISVKKDWKRSQKQDDIFDAETQAMEISVAKSGVSKPLHSSIHKAATQSMEIAVTNSREKECKNLPQNINDAETQEMEISIPKPRQKERTRVVPIAESSRLTSKEADDNIYELETQILPLSTQRNDKKSHDGFSSVRELNDTAESSIHSNSSHGRLRLSSTPPSSPENLDDIPESQNLLEIAETPLLAYEKLEISAKNSSKDPRNSDDAENDFDERKKTLRRRVQTIPESSESETDDEIVTTRVVKKCKPSNVIEDSSEEPTDEENEFAGFVAVRENLTNIQGTSSSTAKGQLEVNKVQSSPLGLQNKTDVLHGETADVSILGGIPIGLERKNDVISSKAREVAPAKGRVESKSFGDSPTSCERKTNEITPKKIDGTMKSKFGASPLRLERKSNEVSMLEGGKAKSNIFGDSPKKNEDLLTKIHGKGVNKFGVSLEKNEDLSTQCGSEGTNKFGAFSKKNDDLSPKNREAPKKFGDSSTINSENNAEIASKKIDENTTNKFAVLALRLSRKRNKDLLETPHATTSGKEENREQSNVPGNSPKKIDALLKIQGEQSKPNAPGRLSMRLSRKSDHDLWKKMGNKLTAESDKSNEFGDIPSRKDLPKKILENKSTDDDDDDDDIFEAATQRVNYNTVAKSATDRDNHEPLEVEMLNDDDNDDMDIDLLPTQILEVPSSTPLSRRSKARKSIPRLEISGDDLHCAPTQIINVDNDEKAVDKDEKSVDKHEKSVDKDDKETNAEPNKTIDLDDSLARNLGNLLGEEANNDIYDNDSTQLMTQNLVDILRPTQSFNETETRNRKSSPRIAGNFDARATSNPLRKKMYAPGTLGFVDGEAKDSSRELVSADSSPIKAAREDKNIVAQAAKTDEPDASAIHPDEDDIFFGLPEVKIAGTLSNPGSPASSTASSHDDITRTVKSIMSHGKFGKKRESSAPKFGFLVEPESSITLRKSRITRRNVSSCRIIDDALDDSEDEFDYQDLKRMADRLLAAGSSSYETKDREKTDNEIAKKIDEISESSKSSTKLVKDKKRVGAKKSAVTRKRLAVKLSSAPSSIVVSDIKSETLESTGESRKSTRQRKPPKIAVTSSLPKVAARQQQQQQHGKESQEIEAILGSTSDENRPMISRKSYATVQLTRLDDSKDDDTKKISNVVERPKITRKRRTMSSIKKETTPPIVSPAASRTRRTIADSPGIPGMNELDHKILFTGIKGDDYHTIVVKLGGTVVSDPSKATVLITDKVRRTYKFLCAVAHGIRVVSINWLLESNKFSRFLDCNNFILSEPEAEAKYKFKLDKSLRIARTKKFLDGWTIIITPKVNQPEVHEMKDMIEASGGRLLVRPGRNWTPKTVIISRDEDFTVAKSYLTKIPKKFNVTVQSTEFILTGILRQELNLVDHKLDFT